MIIENNNLTPGSHKKILVECDFKLCENCRSIWRAKYYSVIKNLNNNNNKIICMYCSRRLKQSGRKGSLCRYKDIDDNIFNKIDTEEKAYILGFLVADGHITKSKHVIKFYSTDYDVIKKISVFFSNQCQVKIKKINNRKDMYYYNVSSVKIHEDCLKHLDLPGGKKCFDIKLPNLSFDLMRHFIRGYFDGDGYITKKNNLSCGITSSSKKILQQISNIYDIKNKVYKNGQYWKLQISGEMSKMFLRNIYNGANIYMERKYKIFLDRVGCDENNSPRK